MSHHQLFLELEAGFQRLQFQCVLPTKDFVRSLVQVDETGSHASSELQRVLASPADVRHLSDSFFALSIGFRTATSEPAWFSDDDG